MIQRASSLPLVAVIAIGVLAPAAALGDIANFDLAGRLYTKWLYRNSATQGLLTLGTPESHGDDYSGDNGVGTEFELKVFGRVTKYVQAYARIQSRFGELWQDWWESGNRNYDGTVNTTGESSGMNHASYMKLRGTYVKAALPIPTLDWVTVGSSDLGMFNAWSIGKVRYIDRDNGKGIFLDGHWGSPSLGPNFFQYSLAMIALPKLYVGPWWSTGLQDPNITTPFWSQDWAYGAKFVVAPSFGTFTVLSTLTNDVEIDRTDPDAIGAVYPNCVDDLGNPILGCSKDFGVDYHSRYMGSNSTVEAQLEPLDWLSVNALGALSVGLVDKKLTANAVDTNQGMSPIVYKDTLSYAARVRAELADPFGIGLSFKAEYFNIGEDYNTVFGARREDDVLLTDGFMEGGQLPTLNLANEFVDFDEQWYESCIGWHGGTLMAQYAYGGLDTSLEGTFITYNTNAQNRPVERMTVNGAEVEPIYPNFLYGDGFTDTDLFDYANTTDRGRDPRAVYRRNQDRHTIIAAWNGKYTFDVGGGLDIAGKFKYIDDTDYRSTHYNAGTNDDYHGRILQARLKGSYGLVPGLRVEVGGQLDRWYEQNRKGKLGDDGVPKDYNDDQTNKEKLFAGLTYEFEGLKFRYLFEFLHKNQYREPIERDQRWVVFRSKASLEVNW